MTEQLSIPAHSEVSRRRFIAAVAAAALSGGGFAFFGPIRAQIAYAETSAEVRAEANKVLAKLDELQNELDIKSNIYFQALAEEQEAEERMADAQRRIDETQEKIDKLKARLAKRVRGMYKGGNSSFMDILFGSTTFSAFVNNVQLLNEMNQDDTETVTQFKELKAAIEVEKEEYTRQEAIAEAKRIEAEEAVHEAEAIIAEMEEIYRMLDAKANALLAAEIEAERQRRLAEERARIEAEEAERRAREAEERAQREAAGENVDDGDDDDDDDDDDGGSGGGSNDGDDDDDDDDDDGGSWVNTGNPIVDRAGQWIGNARYVWAACSPGQFDCSGLVAYAVTGAYRRIGTTWNFVTNTSVFKPICSAGDWGNGGPRAGDIVVCHNNSIQHCGIYTGGSYMIHAASYELGVIQGWFNRDIYQCVRYMG